MTPGVVLKMEGIRKTFPGVVALDGVQLELRRGEVHVLLGENGAGKSTLIKILGGGLRKDAGSIIVDGKETDFRSPSQAQQAGIGIIYQELHLIPALSAAENIFLGREPQHPAGVIDQARLFAQSRKVLDSLSVDIDPGTIVRDLSLAQRQMVEIARAISLGSRILVMDEPTSALTDQEIDRLFAIVERLKQSGVSLLYVSHRMDEIFRIGERITVLLDGKYVGTYDARAVTRAQLIRLMVNRELKEQYPKERFPRGKEVLRVDHLSRHNVLHDVSFSLYAGEVLGIAGLLGSGRTELARALFGLDKPDSGNIRIRGTAHHRMTPRKAIKAGMGFLTEDRKAQGLIPLLSVKDNIMLAALDRLSRFGVLDQKKEASTASRFVNDLLIKTPGLDQRIMYLSGGNQQKALLSRWLASEAEIFIFDEPTRGIDVGGKVEIYRLINRLTSRGAAVIMISSELPEVLGMSDRILVFRTGTIAAELAAGEATPESVLHHALGA